MASFYMIQAYNLEAGGRDPGELLESHALYTTFETACDAIEKEVHVYIDNYNDSCRRDYEDPIVFERPDREALFVNIIKWLRTDYYRVLGYSFVIVKMIVQE